MPNQPAPRYKEGNAIQIKETLRTRRQTVVQKGATGKIESVQASRTMPGHFYYTIRFDDGTQEQGIDEENISPA